MFDLSLYSIALLVHVTAGVVLIGSSLFAPITRRAILSTSSIEALRDWLDFARRSVRANPPAALALLLTGLYLGANGWWSQPWFFVAIAAWLVNVLLAVLVLQRRAMVLGQAAGRAATGPIDAAVDALRRAPSWDTAEDVMLANDLAMIYLMFIKPSLAESCLVVGAGALYAGLRATRRRLRVRERVERRLPRKSTREADAACARGVSGAKLLLDPGRKGPA